MIPGRLSPIRYWPSAGSGDCIDRPPDRTCHCLPARPVEIRHNVFAVKGFQKVEIELFVPFVVLISSLPGSDCSELLVQVG